MLPKLFKVGGQEQSTTSTLVETTTVLTEVVVVGYGTMKKTDISGASVSMGEDQIKGSIILKLGPEFPGRVASVTSVATSGAQVLLPQSEFADESTINAGAEPLYVIDGVHLQGGWFKRRFIRFGRCLRNGFCFYRITKCQLSTLPISSVWKS